MSEGWGQDFDEDGNVIGEVPDDGPPFHSEHKWKIVLASVIVLLINLPRIDIASGGSLLGAGLASLALGYVIVQIGVRLRNR